MLFGGSDEETYNVLISTYWNVNVSCPYAQDNRKMPVC